MANTYTLIASSTATSSTTVTFSSIPSTYTDLLVKCSGRTVDGAWSNWIIRFNGSTSGYTSKTLGGDGTSASSYSNTFTNGAWIGTLDSAGQTANTFTSADIYIPNYNSSNYKSISADNTTETNATVAYSALQAGLWSNTAAITSVSIVTDGGNFNTGSTFYLYGIKNS